MRAQVLLVMGLLYFVWGSTYLAIRVTVETLQPLVAAGVRFLIAGALTLVVLAALGRLGERPTLGQLRGSAIVGVWLLCGGVGLVTITENHAPSNLTAVLASTTSLWVIGYRALAGERLGRGSIFGAVLGVVGVIVLFSPGGSGLQNPWLLLAIVCSLFWSTGSFYGRRLTQIPDPFVGAIVQMFTAGTLMTVAAVALDGTGALDLSAASGRSLLALTYLIVAGGITFSAYVWALQHLPISTVVSHQYVNPAVAVVLGAVFLDETLGLSAVIGAALVIAAVFATVRSESSPVPVTEELVRD
jgi:drug/metabolite transporter (DMT)-like permease